MAATDTPSNRSPEAALAWEAKQRTVAGVSALAAGLLLLLTQVLNAVSLRDQPSTTLADGLRDTLGQPLSTGEPGLRTELLRFYADHSTSLYVQAVVSMISIALMTFVLGSLYRATEARRPIPKIALYLALFGPILSSLAPLVRQIGLDQEIDDYLSGPLSTVGAHDVFTQGLAGVAGALLLFNLLTAAAFVLINLNAMRAGLLTRFIGIIGIIVGVLLVLTLAQASGGPIIIQVFWLAAVGLVILQRLPSTPPAWITGEAVPWLSRQEVLEQEEAGVSFKKGDPRDDVVEADEDDDDEDDDEPAERAVPVRPRPSGQSRKKKRKRR